ncbi:MAG: efflux RND transporter periplasmic adaptor subunit [Burkholderiales bacterium]|nr:efflux RND transporter periplasmic adaptor subunit [Burkholderiales bacterium]
MKNNLVIVGVFAGALIFGAGGYWLGKGQSGSTAASNLAPVSSQAAAKPASGAPGSSGSAIAVEVSTVKSVRMAQGLTAVGSLRSDESVTIRPEVSGRISEIGFREGQRVAKGSTLIRFDTSVQRAELEQAEANLGLSKSRLERSRDLFTKGFLSSQARDEAESNFKIAQANYDLSQARLTKLEIKAPFSGIVGLRMVSIGDYVKDGQDIVNLEEIDPLKVDFRIPEIYLKQVAAGQSLQITLDAFPNQTFQGSVFAINPLVDTNGRAIVIRAMVKNVEARLRPGMFARVRLLFSDERESVAVPEQSLIPVGDDQYLFKVVDGRAQRLKVGIGQRRDGQVEILQGLTAGDVVVTAGQLKLRDGAQVKIAAAAAPTNNAKSAADATKGASPTATGTSPAMKAGGKS